MNLLEIYQAKLTAGETQPDLEQQQVVLQLQALYLAIVNEVEHKSLFNVVLSTVKKLFCRRMRNVKKPNGIYLWGGVGVGKTMLIDMFYNSLPIKQKLRIHFHDFMQYVHNELNRLKNKKEPLKILVQELRINARLLCLDELIVNDIADAMLLSGLFKALYAEGCCIIFTSNVPPEELYKHGLQRQLFLPAISLIKEHSKILYLSSKHDYRRQTTVAEGFYFTPLNEETADKIEQKFIKYADNKPITHEPLLVHGRLIPVIDRTAQVVWFKFIDICGVPRSQNDFLALVKQYNIFIISEVPVIEATQNNLIRSWINLIDVLYDNKAKLVISAAKPPAELYTSGKLIFEYARTQSRLIEMQSQEWQQNILNHD